MTTIPPNSIHQEVQAIRAVDIGLEGIDLADPVNTAGLGQQLDRGMPRYPMRWSFCVDPVASY